MLYCSLPRVFLVGVATLLVVAGIAVTQADAQCYFLECAPQSPLPAPPSAPPSFPSPPPPPPPAGRTYWNHNGSVMYLIVSGNRREFYYHRPRQGMIDEGVRSGTLLFSGTVSGNTYEGTAYLFSARCGARPYSVNGSVQESGGRVVMTGPATIINARCVPVRTITDVLVFDYVSRD